MWEAKFEPNVISCSAGISACAKGVQWQRALALLSGMWEATLETDVILQRWDQRVREGRPVAASIGAAPRDGGEEAEAQRHQLRRRPPRVRERRAVAAGTGAAPRHAGGGAGDQRHLCYNAGTSACEKGNRWQWALAMLSEMWEVELKPNTIYSAGISACEKGEQWQRALVLLSEMWEAKLEPDSICYSAGISSCEKGEQWQRALALLGEMWKDELELNVTHVTYNTRLSACKNNGF
ncbi:unnamed protein product [Prorocentrum cordatum]|uniref:Pentatricopeptide repeat-containing protein, chloroplastic n=1 Tax=Prorocentrum cordatum TaxID=2364126 RepID=A0ABN9W5B9_9DINO|nr:unnamed protein product [Polarella glacialis]